MLISFGRDMTPPVYTFDHIANYGRERKGDVQQVFFFPPNSYLTLKVRMTLTNKWLFNLV